MATESEDSDYQDTDEKSDDSSGSPDSNIPIKPSGAGLLDPALSQARRRSLDIVNRLLGLGIQLDMDIPQIVVIGSQSAGKSSLIESISGITLPRSSGTCTRCPTECILMQSDQEWECRVSLRFMKDASGGILPQVRTVVFGPPIRVPADVEERIRRAQRAALNPDTDPQQFLVGSNLPSKNSLDFTINCVSLEIKGPQIADLSFCDLPGLIASPADGGRVEDVENIRKLVGSYIIKRNCIILLTVACESDFETQGAHLLAKQHDPQGGRTIGVLTKPDRIPSGEEENWIKLIKNERAPLVNGWFCVKQPSSMELKEEGLTFEEARRRGEAYFENAPWSTIDPHHRKKLGTQALTRKLHEYLVTLISTRLPELMKELQRILQQTKDELHKLPAAVRDPVMEVMRIVGDFSDDMFRHAEGLTYTISGSPEAQGDNQFESIRDAHEDFRRKMRSTAPDFRPYNAAFANCEHTNAAPAVYVMDSYERTNLASTNYKHGDVEPRFLKSEENEVTSFSSPPIYLDDVGRRVQKATTRELPGYYPFQVLQDLISCSSVQWEAPALALVESIHRIVLGHHEKLIKLHFGKYSTGGLQQFVSNIIQEYTQKCRDEATERMKWLLALEAHAFTLNKQYLEDYENKFREFYSSRRQAYKHYYPHEPLDPELLDIMATVRAYFQVAYKRVIDTLPLAIDQELVRVRKRGVQDVILSGLRITDAQAQQRCAKFLAEPPEVVKNREDLRSRLDRLTKAHSELLWLDA